MPFASLLSLMLLQNEKICHFRLVFLLTEQSKKMDGQDTQFRGVLALKLLFPFFIVDFFLLQHFLFALSTPPQPLFIYLFIVLREMKLVYNLKLLY